MIVAGFAFKVSAAPFHMWTPDVYEGAPTAVMAFMATATKTIALATLLRVMITAFAPASDVWQGAVAAVAIASMLIGNIAALRQTNVKRMLAYSSVGQAGYLLIAVVGAHAARGARDALLPGGLRGHEPRRDRRRVGARARDRRPGLDRRPARPRAAITRCSRPAWRSRLLSLASFPPTGGFLAKVYLFGSAIDAGKSYLAVFGVIGTMISLAYYLPLPARDLPPAGRARPRRAPSRARVSRPPR